MFSKIKSIFKKRIYYDVELQPNVIMIVKQKNIESILKKYKNAKIIAKRIYN